MMEQTKQKVNKWIEQTFYQMVNGIDIAHFEQHIQQAIHMKRAQSTTSNYLDDVMMNLTYYEQNNAQWYALFEQMLANQVPFTTDFMEAELLMAQMQIRQQMTEQRAALLKLFTEAYTTQNLTENIILYDYAYAMIAHGLRIDFLTMATKHPQKELLTTVNAEETLRIIDGYVNYHADQIARQLTLV